MCWHGLCMDHNVGNHCLNNEKIHNYEIDKQYFEEYLPYGFNGDVLQRNTSIEW